MEYVALRWHMRHPLFQRMYGNSLSLLRLRSISAYFKADDGSLFNGLQSIDEWQEYFGHPDGKTLGLMNSAGFLPGVVASFCSDRFGNIFGRRPTVWIGTLIVVSYPYLGELGSKILDGLTYCCGRFSALSSCPSPRLLACFVEGV